MLTATYRLQFNAAFTLHDARALVPYLARLGVSHLYASPVLVARPGSTHGYDVVDPRAVNPELGGEEALTALAAALQERGMGLLLDIVPNHMGTGPANPFWDDVLARGRASRYAGWFDIDWGAPPARGRLLLPVLGDRLDAVIARGELRVVRQGDGFRVAYYENSFPLDPATAHARLGLDPASAAGDPAALEERLAAFGAGDDGRPRMRALLDAQHYALVWWRRAAREVDYRRFFDVNDLVALRADAPGVFEETHARLLGWVGDGTVDALRVDHVDGLADPRGYLDRLRAEVRRRRPGAHVPLFVEKILSHGERLREEWPVDGTTGYEFANDVEALLIDPVGAAAIERGYQRLAGGHARRGFDDAARRGKAYVLRTSLAADVRRLTRALRSIPRAPGEPPLRSAALAHAVEELIVALPVYRTYVGASAGGERVSAGDRALVEQALAAALARRPANAAALRAVAAVLAGDTSTAPTPVEPGRRSFDAAAFVARFQQTSGPATAKGVEDTALYRYVPLVSRNEVGGEGAPPPDGAAARLHAANAERARRWPANLLAVTTHDTKRSADVRARLDVLSELPDAWIAQVARWTRRHRALRTRLRGRLVPDPNTEYLLYQTALGVWPLDGADEPAPPDAVADRVEAYMLKAAREAKTHTSWTHPRPEFEAALAGFVRALLRDEAGAAFRAELGRLAALVAPAAFRNALARTLVHLTAPGVPDIYQGDELWNLALVDPDNRRPVDYARRGALLDTLAETDGDVEARAALLAAACAEPARDGGLVKLLVIRAALAARRALGPLFAEGDYQPLAPAGAHAARLFAFARTHAGSGAVAVVARHTHALPAHAWADATVALPAALSGAALADALTGAAIPVGAGGVLGLGPLLARCPVALVLAHRG